LIPKRKISSCMHPRRHLKLDPNTPTGLRNDVYNAMYRYNYEMHSVLQNYMQALILIQCSDSLSVVLHMTYLL